MKHGSILVLTIFLLGGTCPIFGDSVIEGVVQLSKTKHAPVVNQRYEIISKGGVIAPNPPVAVVYLEGSFARPSTAPVKELKQKDLQFIPPLLPIQTGTKVEFPNLDDTYHNVFSYSPTKRFDLGRYRSDERPIPSQIFDQAGLVTLRCDIHEHMRGAILILDTPYFVTTGTDGVFRLTALPPGHYTLKAWLSSKSTLERAVDLTDGAVLKVDFR